MDGRSSYENRPKATDPFVIDTRDGGVPLRIDLKSMPYQRFGTIYAKYFNLLEKLNWEEQEKYSMRYTAKSKARADIISLPMCFNKCMSISEDNTLTSGEKNCMRECYFRK